MKDAIARLARARQIVTEQETALAEMTEELYASPLGLYLNKTRESLQKTKAAQADAEIDVREIGRNIFAETGDKTPHPAVKIKIYTALDYTDGDAVEYAREHLPQALKLIKNIFEAAAKVIKLDFVTMRKEPRATIARDLSKYLPDGTLSGIEE